MGERLGKEMSDLQFYTMQDGGRYTPVTMSYELSIPWRPFRWKETSLGVAFDISGHLDDYLNFENADYAIRDMREAIAQSVGCKPEDVSMFCPVFRRRKR